MKRKDKLIAIYNAIKLIAPGKEYDLSDYDLIHFDRGKDGYIQVFSVNRSIYVESTSEVPFEITALFKLRELSSKEFVDVYDLIERNDTLWNSIGTPCAVVDLYEATPIDRNLFKTT